MGLVQFLLDIAWDLFGFTSDSAAVMVLGVAIALAIFWWARNHFPRSFSGSCGEHRTLAMYGWPVIVLLMAYGLANGPLFRCELNGRIEPRVVSRLFFLGDLKEGTNPASFQELFLSWRITLSTGSLSGAEDVEVAVRDLQDSHRFHVPLPAKLSDARPEWLSGFQEPHSTPDGYSRPIEIPLVSRSEPYSFEVRRPLDSSLVGIRRITMSWTAKSCTVSRPTNQWKRHVLLSNARAFMRFFPLGTDPGDVQPKKLKASVELECSDADCETWRMSRLEARINRDPKP